MNKCVVFSGLDCSGKSTQIALLSNKLRSEGFKVHIFWSRGGYTPGMQGLKNIARFSFGKGLPPSGRNGSRDKAISHPMIRKVWLTLAIIDLIVYYGFILRFRLLRGEYVLCDRYLIDTSIDFELNFPEEKVKDWYLWKVLEFWAVKPMAHFVSTVPVKVSLERSKHKYEPFPDSPETLGVRLKGYERYLELPHVTFIDGLKSREDNFDLIYSTIGEYEK